MNIKNFFSTLDMSAKGLSAQKRQLAVTAENIANATTTRTAGGTAYKRKFLLKKAINDSAHFSNYLNRERIKLRTDNPAHIKMSRAGSGNFRGEGGDIRTEIEESNNFIQVYDPSHPDADEEGIVEYPDVNVINEMLELISSSRLYEANITVMNATKNLAKKSLEI